MEFDLIKRHFTQPFTTLSHDNADRVVAGIGDDCAALQLAPGLLTYVSTDTLVEGVHFFPDDSPQSVGWKSLACNLSDLAACGADPLGFTLNISLPAVNDAWLAGFSSGLLSLARQHNCPLIGGDTTSAGVNQAITLTITVLGQAPGQHRGFHRSQAKATDQLWVSGTPGLARLGLLLAYRQRGQLERCCQVDELGVHEALLDELPAGLRHDAALALQKPLPRLALGRRLRGLAHAAIDLSDGLSGDLAHIAHSSELCISVSAQALKDIWLQKWPGLLSHPRAEQVLETLVRVSLQGGDDFELCWTAPSENQSAIQSLGLAEHDSPEVHCIGHLSTGSGVWLLRPAGQGPLRITSHSFNHFAESPH